MTLRLRRKIILTPLLLLAVVGFATTPSGAKADTVAIIGTGRVAAALGPQFAKLGHRIIYGSRDPARASVQDLLVRTHKTASAISPSDAAAQANIIVLATPWTATEQVVKGLGDLAGKIIIDPTNAYAKAADGLREIGVETSAAELIQGWAPQAHVVKAFNTLNSATMENPGSAGGPVTIPIVGDNKAAKDQVAALITGIGLEVVDLGPLRYARVVENMLIVWMNARIMGHPFDYHLRSQQAE
jgi:predicted dinucleotide-binding enzyme